MTTTSVLIESGVLEIGDGYRAKNAEFVPNGGLPFVRVGDVGSSVSLEGLDELPLERTQEFGSKVSRPGDSLITMKGTVGRVAYVSEAEAPFVYSPQISYWRSHDPERVHPRWLQYWLESPEFLGQAAATKGATDMADYINLRDQRRMRMSLPPVAVQRRIAGVIEAFDELIANNRRRIEILEETARSLYREWFVRYGFPGHDSIEFVESPVGPVPEGWSVESFSELGEFVNGFAFKPGHWHDEGLPIIKIKELKNGVTPDTPCYPGDDIKEKYRVHPGDLLFSWSGHLDAYIWPGPEAWLNQHLFQVDERQGLPRTWLFHALRDRMEEFRVRSQGTTMKHIKRAALQEVRVPVPDEKLLYVFDEQASPLMELSILLQEQTVGVARARDRLLPKLVTGQIDVDSLDVDGVFGWAEVDVSN